MMKRAIQVVCVAAIVAALGSAAMATVNIEMVPVGNPGNAGNGKVDYAYNMGKYEVTAGQYRKFLNAVAATDTYGLYNENMDMASNSDGCNIKRTGSSGNYSYTVTYDWADRPVNYVSWGDAARFVNWLTNGQPIGFQNASTTEDGSYHLNGATSDAALLAVTRKTVEQGGRYYIPTETEWYKAAYHKNDGVTGNYFPYPTSSHSLPSNDLINPDPGNNANFKQDGGYTLGGLYKRTPVGEFENSDSPYGTFDQGGNVWEWDEVVLKGTDRGIRGGAFDTIGHGLTAANRGGEHPTLEHRAVGFRVSEVPEPATLLLLTLGGLALLPRKHPRS